MIKIDELFAVVERDFHWTFVRSSGPGGQNVNKVASCAVLRWNLAASPALPEDVKQRLVDRQKKRINSEGTLIVRSDRYRDQRRNIEDCLEKLLDMLAEAIPKPKARKPTRRTMTSHKKRLDKKRRRAAVKQRRRKPAED